MHLYVNGGMHPCIAVVYRLILSVPPPTLFFFLSLSLSFSRTESGSVLTEINRNWKFRIDFLSASHSFTAHVIYGTGSSGTWGKAAKVSQHRTNVDSEDSFSMLQVLGAYCRCHKVQCKLVWECRSFYGPGPTSVFKLSLLGRLPEGKRGSHSILSTIKHFGVPKRHRKGRTQPRDVLL